MNQDEIALLSFGKMIIDIQPSNNVYVARVNKDRMKRFFYVNGEFDKYKFFDIMRSAEALYDSNNDNKMGFVINMIIHYGFYMGFDEIPEEIPIPIQ